MTKKKKGLKYPRKIILKFKNFSKIWEKNYRLIKRPHDQYTQKKLW